MLDLNTLVPGNVVVYAFPLRVTRWTWGAERLVRTDYAALIAAKGDERNEDRRFLCDHRHRTVEAATKCGATIAYRALRRNGYKVGASK